MKYREANFYISFRYHSHGYWAHFHCSCTWLTIIFINFQSVTTRERWMLTSLWLHSNLPYHSHKFLIRHSCDLMHIKTTVLQFKSNSDALCHWTVCLDGVWGNMRPTSSISSLQQPNSSKREKKKRENCFSFQASTFKTKTRSLSSYET